MIETRVGHVRYDDTDVYAGRGAQNATIRNTDPTDRGWLGNPFTVEKFGREQAIRHYREAFERRLRDDPDFRAAVRQLHGQVLGCFCQRLHDDDGAACHAEVIAEHADRLATEVPADD